MATVNVDNAETAQRFEHTYMKNADGSPLRAKRNGKTKFWKTKAPGMFAIPAKHGLKDYFYIDNKNAHEWNVVS
jgi:hypothetical protein